MFFRNIFQASTPEPARAATSTTNDSPSPAQQRGRRQRGTLVDPAVERLAEQLDLTRITDRLLVAGQPWRRASERKLYRLNVDELARVLDGRYAKRYMVWDVSGRRESITRHTTVRDKLMPC